MTWTPQPVTHTGLQHSTRAKNAEDIGYRAGWEHAHIAAETCDPDEWKPAARECWKALLRELRVNPYGADQYPYVDATDAQNATYHAQWEKGYVRGERAARADIARKATVTR